MRASGGYRHGDVRDRRHGGRGRERVGDLNCRRCACSNGHLLTAPSHGRGDRAGLSRGGLGDRARRPGRDVVETPRHRSRRCAGGDEEGELVGGLAAVDEEGNRSLLPAPDPLMFLVTVNVPGVSAKMLMNGTTTTAPPATVTVWVFVGSTVTVTVLVAPSAVSVMVQLEPGGTLLKAGVCRPAGVPAGMTMLGNKAPLQVAAMVIGPCWPANGPARSFGTMMVPDDGLYVSVTATVAVAPAVTVVD